jgi:hypothetical protein
MALRRWKMVCFRRGPAWLATVLVLGVALTAGSARAQFVGYAPGYGFPGSAYGNGYGYPGYALGGYGYGYPGLGYGYGGYGYPGLGYGYGGYGYPGYGYGYPGFGYGLGYGYGGYAYGTGYAGFLPYTTPLFSDPYSNPLFGLGLSPLGVQSALAERAFLGRGLTGPVRVTGPGAPVSGSIPVTPGPRTYYVP